MNPYSSELCHHGILGQRWGVRRFQNSDGSLTSEGKNRYGVKEQKREQKIAKKSQKIGYRSNYDRQQDYYSKSKVIQNRSKELAPLANKYKELVFKMEDYQENPKVEKEARKRALSMAKKDSEYGKYGEKHDNRLIDYYLYDKNVLKNTANEMLKNDQGYKNLKKEYDNTKKEYKEKCRKIADEIIGDIGDEKIKGLGTDMNYRELTYYALSKQHPMLDFTYEEDMGRK